MSTLIGRQPEQAVLQKTLESKEPEFVAVYGRRRVGKTFLVREFYGDGTCFELTGAHEAALGQQLQNFAFCLEQAMKTGIRPATPRSWQEAFQQLSVFLETLDSSQKRVVFLDELPWLASRRSGFLATLEHFWNAWASKRPHIITVICGSAASWMIGNILRHRGGLHNRITRRIRLEPFSLAETMEYLKSREVDLGYRQTLELYMAMGGIPHYLKEVTPGRSAAQNIDDICFSETGLLRDEFDKLYVSLFEHSDRHVRVVRAMAERRQGLTRSQVLEAAEMRTGGTITGLLDELAESGFVLRTLPFGKDRKDALYRLADEYSLFYLNWIENNRSPGPDTWLKLRASPAWRAWSGYAFEGICLKHLRQLKRALGIEAVETTESAWTHRPSDPQDTGAQIDLLIDRRDDCINLCEMKFTEGEFVIDKSYAAELRNKLETFRRVTGTRKALFLTMVTAGGVKENPYRSELVANTIPVEALFA
jgi:hypothetical protein